MLDINTIAYRLPIEVDSARILNEIDNLVLPHSDSYIRNKNHLLKSNGAGISITGLQSFPPENWYRSLYHPIMSVLKDNTTGEHIDKKYGTFTLGFPGAWRDNLEASYDNGIRDKDLIHWHPSLINSEIYNLKNRIADFLKISNQLRCRLSFSTKNTKLGFHSDPHTPWRVHVNLKSGPNTYWKFRTLDPIEIIKWKQPTESVWLIRTGNVQHAVEVGDGEIRQQLFYHIWERDLGLNYHQIV